MSLLTRAVRRQLWTQRGMTVSMVCGIALAAGSVVAVHLIADLVQRGVNVDGPAGSFGFTHFLHRSELGEADYLALRTKWRAGGLPQVSTLTPIVEGHATGQVGGHAKRFRIVGLDPLSLRQPSPDGERTLPRVGASWLMGEVGWIAGSTDTIGERGDEQVKFATDSGSLGVLIADRIATVSRDEPTLIVDIGVAQRLLDRPGSLSRIGVVRSTRVGAGVHWGSRLFPGLAAHQAVGEQGWQPDGFEVESVRDRGERLFAAAILFNLSVLSVLSAVVAAFLIHQGAVNSISHRTVLFDRLQAMGIADGWLTLHVVLEGLVVALLGAALGCGIGWFVAQGLVHAALGPDAEVVLDTRAAGWAWSKAVVLSVVVGALGMWLGLRRVTRPGGEGTAGFIVIAGLAAIGFGWQGVGGVFAIIAAVALVGAVIAARGLGLWTLSGANNLKGTRFTSAVNRRSLFASRSEIGVALGGLVIALVAAYGLSLMVANFRIAFEAMLDQRLDADAYLDATGHFTAADVDQILGVVGPEADMRLERRDAGRVLVGDTTANVMIIHDAGADPVGRYGYTGPMDPRTALINEPASRRFAWTIGDSITVTAGQGVASLSVAGVFRDYGASTARIVVASSVGEALFGPGPSRAIGLSVPDPTRTRALERLAQAREWRYRDSAQVRSGALDVFDRTFRLSDALVWIAVAIAVVGLFNGLVAVRIRRQSEFRLLYVMGVSRGEFLRMNLGYGALLGIHAVVVALPIGILVGWLLCEVLNPRAFGWSVPFTIDVQALVFPGLMGIVGAILSAFMPGVRFGEELADAA